MGVEQLPGRVREFATYLNGLLARLDQGAGWCGVFWQRDPDGMRACLDGWEAPPWDVVEALLQDLEGQYGPRAAAQETERARTLHAASLIAFDGRPGGREALGDRLDVMLREQRYAAERQAELGRQLHAAGSQEEAEAVRLDLAWARDDHDRATARCAEIRRRTEDLDRRAHAREERDFPADGTGGAGARRQDGHEARSASTGRHAGPYAPSAGQPDPYAPSARQPGPSADAADRHTGPSAPADRQPGPAAGRSPAWSAFAERAPADVDHAGARPDDGYAAGRPGGDHADGRSDDGYGAGRSGGDHAGGRPGDGYAPEPGAPRAEPDTSHLEPEPEVPTPAPAPPVPKQRAKRRPRGSARFAGMMETEAEATPAAAPPTAAPAVPAQAAKGRTPGGARFAGAAAQPARPDVPRREPLDDAARQETVDTVEALVRLRAEGRTGEAHALLVEAAYWPAARFPLLAAQLHRAGLDADWATLLWEAASLPADRLVAAADALVAAGRTADGSQMLRQGVARPAPEIGAAVQGLAAEGRHREIRALLDAYVRVRTPEEAARSVEADPVHLVPLLLEAARGASEERYWDLVHALRVAGIAT
ncbi:hypothetical protein [Streptomyces sp. NPDC058371]|uniref:hypothetical protein n=1 Tax=Streptomyces sp. NPDC058371 TaxID=3346463 RepID=UPI00366144F8